MDAEDGGCSVAHEVTRRSFLAGSGALALGGGLELVTAGDAGAVVTHGRGRDGISRTRPKRGGTLHVGVNAEEQGFNPATGRFDAAGFLMARTVFDPLFIITATGTVAPYLAQSITPNGDHTAWTVTLRPGIKFHDGTPLDADVLVANFTAGLNSPLAGIAIQPLVSGAKRTGPLSMTIELKLPWVSFPYTYAATQIAFVSAPSMSTAPNAGSDHPVGTGPFVFDDWVPNDHFTVRANPHYWRAGLPYLDRIIFKPIPDDSARYMALQSGTIDLMHAADAATISQLRQNRSLSYVDNSGKMVGSPNVSCMLLNLSKPPFDDPLARKILATGISAKAYSQIIDKGVNAPVDGIYQPGSPWYTKVPYPTYNQAAAKKLADEYRAKHGHPLSFTSLGVATPQSTTQGSYLQQVLKNIGVDLTLAQASESEVISDALAGTFEAVGWQSFGGNYPDLNYGWFSTKTLRTTGTSLNIARNDDPQVEAAMVAGMGETNPRKAAAAFAKVNQRLAVDLPYIWTDRAVWAVASTAKVQNWNNPTTPAGGRALGMDQGVVWLAQAWLS